MKITLRYHPFFHNDGITSPDDDICMSRRMEVKNGTDISDILPEIHGKGLAVCDEHCVVSDNYKSSGKLVPNKSYHILSANVGCTIEFMKG